MTGVSGSELLVLLLLAYLLLGPREAMWVFRAIGQVTSRCRQLLRQMQREFDAAMREADRAGAGRVGPAAHGTPGASPDAATRAADAAPGGGT